MNRSLYFNFSFADEIIPITRNCLDYGVFGVSLFLSDLAEDLIYYINRYPHGEISYAFLMDKNGLTVWHPSFPRTNVAGKTHFPTDIKYFEKVDDTNRQRWLNEYQGSAKISLENNNKVV